MTGMGVAAAVIVGLLVGGPRLIRALRKPQIREAITIQELADRVVASEIDGVDKLEREEVIRILTDALDKSNSNSTPEN